MTRRKPTEADMLEAAHVVVDGMTTRMHAAAQLVAAGKTDAEVGEAVGVTRQTVNAWRNHHAGFAVEVEGYRRELWSVVRERLLGILPQAVDALERGMSGRDGWRPAMALLQMAAVAAPEGGMKPSGPKDVGEFWQRRGRSLQYHTPVGEFWETAAVKLAAHALFEVEAVGEGSEVPLLEPPSDDDDHAADE